ncbi:hypothetical protein SAMN04488563_5331 [Jiangella alkaliphila]|uniref:Uncharacterized protein n=1 Tax=Jiangella alkaliphila TaxID=419479 RepID=A0A1H2L7M6_9ACTN|nr:hypothetical protein SAMN04488563_5331 [Jiangella alkaliphila]
MTEHESEPPRALVMVPVPDLFPAPWFVPTDQPACAAVIEIPAEQTRDGVARRSCATSRPVTRTTPPTPSTAG